LENFQVSWVWGCFHFFNLPGDAEKPKGSKGSKGSIAYAALHARTEAFLKASRNYQVAVKGPLMDATDVYLQEKARMNQDEQ